MHVVLVFSSGEYFQCVSNFRLCKFTCVAGCHDSQECVVNCFRHKIFIYLFIQVSQIVITSVIYFAAPCCYSGLQKIRVILLKKYAFPRFMMGTNDAISDKKLTERNCHIQRLRPEIVQYCAQKFRFVLYTCIEQKQSRSTKICEDPFLELVITNCNHNWIELTAHHNWKQFVYSFIRFSQQTNPAGTFRVQ